MPRASHRTQQLQLSPFVSFPLIIAFLIPASLSATSRNFHSPELSAASFNPTVGQTVMLRANVAKAGTIRTIVLDRDGFPVRRLSAQQVRPGPVAISWDGRDDRGRIVPDEAYSFKTDFSFRGANETYFPANDQRDVYEVRAEMYDRTSGILKYTLPRASRVHIQAGSLSTLDSGERDGPVMKTIVNRAPRVAGSVIEHWNGYDESRSTYLPELTNFVVGIAATPLPENSVITIGNRERSFLEWARDRSGASLVTNTPASHHHHQGLDTLRDVAPRLDVEPLDAEWSKQTNSWALKEGRLRIQATLAGLNAKPFSEMPATLMIFVDGRRVAAEPTKGISAVVEVPVISETGDHIVAVNWATAFGPVAVNTFRIKG